MLIIAGGGLSPLSGGVGRLLGYLMDEWRSDAEAIPVRVLDSRGQGGAAGAVLSLLRAVGALVAGRLTGTLVCVHLHMTTRGSALRKALLCVTARLLGVPAILHLHGADFFEFHASLPAPLRALLRRAVLMADSVVVIGAAWQRQLVRTLRIPPDRVHVVLNGVPAPSQARTESWPPHIVFLGRLGARKGVSELITALSSAAMANRSWTATIAGDGDGAPFHAQIETAGLRRRVRLPGWQSPLQTESLLADASILVLPSHHEVMPLAVLEAMARGIAVVTTPVGSIPDILQDNVSALLVPPGAPRALAAALGALVDQPALRRMIGEAGHEVFTRRLRVDVVAADLQALYRSTAARRQGPRQAQAAVAGTQAS